MKKWIKWLLAVLGILALAGLVAAALWHFLYQRPYQLAQNTLPEDGIMTLTAQADGTFLLCWPEATNADCYTVEFLPLEAGSEEDPVMPLFSVYVEGENQWVLPSLPREPCILRVSSGKHYHVPRNEYIRPGERVLEISGSFAMPSIQNLTWKADPVEQTVEISFDLAENETCELYFYRGDLEAEIRPLETGRTTYTFGTGGEYPLPMFAETYRFSGSVCRTQPGLIFYGLETEGFTLGREDLLGTVLKLNCKEEGYNVYTLTWNETKGAYYELQMCGSDDEDWQTLCTIQQGDPLEYTTGHLSPFTDYQFRVLALGGQTLPGSEYAATPDAASLTTGSSPIFTTIWPIMQLPIYSSPDGQEEIGAVAAGSTNCVLEEVGDWFGIRYGDSIGYIDSRYCMINLPEYLGDICLYNITNSYSSLYMVHDYEIPEVTDTVVTGYENVQQYDGSFLVPLLYPTAKKLEVAALAAMAEGYQITIYDSYRPRMATLAIYDLTELILDNPIPEYTYAEWLELDPEIREALEQEKNSEPDPQPDEEDPEQEGEGAEGEGGQQEEDEEPRITYRQLMLDGRYSLGNFLAKSGSNHNLGIAMDLTLTSPDGEDLQMQTAMHDLSWFSEIWKNNNNANLLKQIMQDAGFGGLTSEWWHFQDNDAKAELKLPSLYSGISAEGWMADDNGWRYRQSDGLYYTDCDRIIDGVTYHFDQNGYVQE